MYGLGSILDHLGLHLGLNLAHRGSILASSSPASAPALRILALALPLPGPRLALAIGMWLFQGYMFPTSAQFGLGF